MADISSFLSDGQIPAQMAYKSLTSQTVLPDWYTNYAMQLLSNQRQQMETPYAAYQGPRVAEFSPYQQQGFEATPTAANAYQPALGQATQATQTAMGQTSLGTAQPYFTQAAGMNPLTAATPGLEQGAQLTGQSANALGMQAAQPYLGQAAQTSVANIGQYMNPYTEQVVNRIADIGARNLNEKLMPAITGKYISAGQLGYGPRSGFGTPSGMLTDTARALRDTQEATLAEQNKALQAGYGQAAELSAADLARQASLAGTAGSLGTQQQQALAQAGQQMGALGQISGNLTAQQQQMLANIGSQMGALGGADISRQLAGAQQLAGMGEAAQTLGLRGAGALQQVGGIQQAQAQKNIDVAYQDFLRQQGYNQEQINAALGTLQGVAPAVPKAVTEEGIVPTGNTATYQPSTADTVGSFLSGAAGVLSKANSTNALGKLLGL